MADYSSEVDKMEKEAMKVFREYTDESFDEDEVEEIIRKRISKEQHHAVELRKLGKEPTYANIKEAIDALLTPDEIQNILTGFEIETFTMEIHESQAKLLRKKKAFMDTIKLVSPEGILSAKWVQIASFVVEMVLFALSVIGVRADIEKPQMRRILENVTPIVKSPAYQRIIAEFMDSWRSGGILDKAKAIFHFLDATYSFGILMRIIKMVVATMSVFEKMKAMAEVTAMLIAAFATDGAALIAKIALAIDSAVNIVVKVTNLKKLEEMYSKYDG